MEGKAALFKRFGGVDAWPVVLDTQDTDEIVRDRAGDRPGVRRDQPGGHRRAALLRDRGAAARAAGHPGLPRRPARHRDLRAGRADQRAAGGRQAARATCGSWSPASAPPARRSSSCCCARASATSSPTTGRAPCTAACPSLDRLVAVAGREHQPRQLRRRPARRDRAAPTCSSGSRAPNLLTGDDIADDGRRTRSSSRWPTPTRRSTRGRPASTPPSSPPAAPTSRTRSTTCWRSRACSAACSTPAPRRSPRRWRSPRPTRSPTRSAPDKLNPTVIVPSVFDPQVAPAVAAAVRAAAVAAPSAAAPG